MTVSSGVYLIRNKISGRVYVGSGKLKRRWLAHRGALRRGKHHSPVFQRSYDLHGEAAFVFEVLEYVADTDELAAREPKTAHSLLLVLMKSPARATSCSSSSSRSCSSRSSPALSASRSRDARSSNRAINPSSVAA